MVLPHRDEIEILPSILSADPAHLSADIQRIVDAGGRLFHFDVMDGHFVPNLTFGPHILKGLARKVDAWYDVHLMVSNPGDVIPWFKHERTRRITIHVEAEGNTEDHITAIEEAGAIPGLTIRPMTPAEAVEPYLDRVGLVLVMTVEPGFPGQSFRTDVMDKLERIASQSRTNGQRRFHVQVDGGIDEQTIETVVSHGANSIVAGSTIFEANDPAAMYRTLMEKAVGAASA